MKGIKHEWLCPTCGNTVTTYIKLSEPPTCANNHQTQTMTIKGKTK